MNRTARLANTAPRPRTLAAALLTLLTLLATSGNAHATTGHGFSDSFGGLGSEEGKFNPRPTGVGVGTAGEVFVSDSGPQQPNGLPSPRIQRFSAAGVFQVSFPVENLASVGALAVDSGAEGGIYVVGTNPGTGAPEYQKYSAAGVFQYDLDASLSGTSLNHGPIAVDPSTGTVYLTAINNETFLQEIDSFNGKTGAFITAFNGETASPDGAFQCPAGLAADATHVYVFDVCKARVDSYSPAGTYEATVENGSRGGVQAIASNPQTGELYSAEAGPAGLQITNFSAGGTTAIQTFPATHVESLAAMAVGPEGTVFAADGTNSVIDRFTPFEGPTVVTEAASEIQRRSATLNGTLNPEGKASEYHYDYGPETSYGKTTAAQSAGSASTAEPAPSEVEGLIPNTLYHFRVVGSNAQGSIVGEDRALMTEAAPPVVDGSPAFASAITPTGARIHATVNPEHSLTTFRIEYGTTAAYGSSSPEGGAEVGEQSEDTPVATTLTGLQPGTEYHYRVSAEDNVEGPQTGADGTFITSPGTPGAATGLTTKKATLTGAIDPHGSATTYHFNYGPSSAYGASTPEASGGSGNAELPVSAPVSGLSPATTYHVQVVAITNGLTRSGADGTFTTPPAPEATVSDPTAVTTASATLQGAANTNGLAGSYHFEILAPDGSYSANTEEQSLPATSGSQPVSVAVSGLPPGESFQIRLILTSNEASDFSGQVSFNTAQLPPQGFPAPPAPASLYGCTAPKLNPVAGRVKPGSRITVSGGDLGLGGTVLLGEFTLNPTDWSASGFTLQVPADALGTLGLTVNCGVASNTVAVATEGTPENSFTVTKQSVKGQTATFTIELPGPGALQSSSARTKPTVAKVTKAGAQTVKVALSKAGAKALKKAKKHRLAVKVQLRFTPTGGTAASQSASVTFKRAGH